MARGSYEALGAAWELYADYIEGKKHLLPRHVYEFAIAKWHYDPKDHRSLHDSWVESVAIREAPTTEDVSARQVAIDVRLLGPYHDGHTVLNYSGVARYSIIQSGASSGGRAMPGWHGNWMIDEIRISERGLIVHDVVFDSGAEWSIECTEFHHATTTPSISE